MRTAQPLWTSRDIAELNQIRVYAGHSPIWLMLIVAGFFWATLASSSIVLKILGTAVLVGCIFLELRGCYLDVRISKKPDGKGLEVTEMMIFKTGDFDVTPPKCDWRMLIPISGWSGNGLVIKNTGAPVPEQWHFVVSGVKFNLLNVQFVVLAGNNRVAYDIDDLVSILEYQDGNILGHTRRIGGVLKSPPYRTV